MSTATCWKCWTIFSATLAIAIAVIAFQIYKTSQLRSAQSLLIQQRDAARAEADAAGAESARRGARVAALTKERDELRAQIEQSGAQIDALPAVPETLPDCMQGLAALRAHVQLLRSDLALADQQVLALNEALVLKDHEATLLRQVIAIDADRFKLMERSRRKERRRNIWMLTVSHMATAAGFYFVGRAQ